MPNSSQSPLPEQAPAVEFKGVGKTFKSGGKKVTALTDITFAIDRSEIFGVIGHSGAGKSTLVRLINGLEKASSGTVRVHGTEVTGLREGQLRPIRKDIGMIFQQFNLLESRTVSANIGFALSVAGWPRGKRTARIAELLEFVGLSDKARSYPGQLSGGQKQRVGIARALAADPKLLLADESTSALDPETTHEVLELLRTVNRELGLTIVVITHELEVIRAVAHRVAVLSEGRVVELDTAFNVFAHPKTETARGFVETANPRTLSADDKIRIGTAAGTLISIDADLTEPVWRILGSSQERGVSFDVVHGGVTPVGTRAFTAITVRLSGVDQAIAELIRDLSEVATVNQVEVSHE